MITLYIASTKSASGKTAVALSLGLRLKADQYRVGYLKPLSLPSLGDETVDEDARLAKEVLRLEQEVGELLPVVATPEKLLERLKAPPETNSIEQVQAACRTAGEGKDVLLLEGGGSLREGYALGLPVPQVAQALGSRVLLMVRFVSEIQMFDDILATQAQLGEALCGVIVNRLPPESRPFIVRTAAPYLEKKGLPLLGALPDVVSLSAMTVGEIVSLLKAEVLTHYYRPTALVENLTVGAMTAETALSRFRQFSRKAVITGGDRTDLQMAALETSTTCLILTGGLRPSPLVVKQAEEFGVAVLLTPRHTLEAVEAIERLYGRTRLGHMAKLRRFRELMDKHCNYQRLYEAMGL